MTLSLEQAPIPVPVAREVYETGSVSFGTALRAIRSADHSGQPRLDWESTPQHRILTTWLDGVKENLPKLSLRSRISTAIAGMGLAVDAASVGAAYAIHMGNENILRFCQQADTFIAAHGGEALLQFIDTAARAPQVVNTFSMVTSPVANAILTLASYSDVLNKGVAFGAVIGAPIAIEEFARRRNIRIENGTEKIHRGEKVGTALIGPMSLMDAIAEASKAMKLPKSKDLIIHADPGTPGSLGKSTERHFSIPADALNSFSRYIREKISDWGLKKAKRLVLAAFDENFSLFYGPDATRGLTTSNMTTILAALAPQESREGILDGKRALLLAPDGASIVGASTTVEFVLHAERQPEYLKKLLDCGMKIDIETPESILYESKLADILTKAKEKGNKTVILVGSDGDVELNMLKRFSAFLKERDAQLDVHIITDTSVDGKKVDVGVKSNEAKNLIQKAGTILVYAESDTKTTDATEGVLSHGVIAEEAIPDVVHSIIESTDAFIHDAGGLPANRICVFDEIAAFTKEWIDKR